MQITRNSLDTGVGPSDRSEGESVGGARRDEAGFVRVDHGLDAVAEIEFLQDPGDVRASRLPR